MPKPLPTQVTPAGGMHEVAQYDTADGLYDCAWSEANENVLVAASGDGSIKVGEAAAVGNGAGTERLGRLGKDGHWRTRGV